MFIGVAEMFNWYTFKLLKLSLTQKNAFQKENEISPVPILSEPKHKKLQRKFSPVSVCGEGNGSEWGQSRRYRKDAPYTGGQLILKLYKGNSPLWASGL